MAVERILHCDGPDCEVHGRTATPPPWLPYGFIEVRQTMPGRETDAWHFCGWECAMRYGATLPPPEIIPWDEVPGAEA